MNVLLLETIAFIGATVHSFQPAPDGAPGPFQEPAVASVLVDDGLITAVGPSLEIPEGAQVVDLTGLHLVPGMIDAFVSFDAPHDPLYLRAGVTLLRDAGSPMGEMLMEKSRSMRERNPGPTLHVTSTVFVSQSSTRPGAFMLGPAEAAEAQIAEFLSLVMKTQSRLETISFDASLSADQHRVLCQAALEYGAEPWGPVPAALSIDEARNHGQRTLVGLESLLPRGQRFETLPADHDFGPAVASLRDGGWRVVPLLMGTARILRGAASADEPAIAKALGPEARTAWRLDHETFRILAGSPGLDLARLSLERQRDLVRQLHEAGVQLVPGTGAPSGFLAPGSSLVDELEEWARAGVSPGEALALTTARAADALGFPEESGRIAPGLSANLLALGADPRRSVQALRDPELVVIRGRLRERFDLDDAVAALMARQEAADRARSARIELEAPPMPEGKLVVDGQANLESYGLRSAVERYQVVELGDGATAYGARIRVLPSADQGAKELVLLQVLKGGLLQRFLLTLDELNAEGTPERQDEMFAGFSARGSVVGATGNLSVERLRHGQPAGSMRTEEAIAFIEGSSVLSGLIAAHDCPDGASYALLFDPAFMEPVVDRVVLSVAKEDGRFTLQDTRGVRVFGFGQGGEFLFGARAEGGGRLDFLPVVPQTPEQRAATVSTLLLDEARVFRGDPDNWNRPAPAAAAEGAGK